jgi:hypothetical protein
VLRVSTSVSILVEDMSRNKCLFLSGSNIKCFTIYIHSWLPTVPRSLFDLACRNAEFWTHRYTYFHCQHHVYELRNHVVIQPIYSFISGSTALC